MKQPSCGSGVHPHSPGGFGKLIKIQLRRLFTFSTADRTVIRANVQTLQALPPTTRLPGSPSPGWGPRCSLFRSHALICITHPPGPQPRRSQAHSPESLLRRGGTSPGTSQRQGVPAKGAGDTGDARPFLKAGPQCSLLKGLSRLIIW